MCAQANHLVNHIEHRERDGQGEQGAGQQAQRLDTQLLETATGKQAQTIDAPDAHRQHTENTVQAVDRERTNRIIDLSFSINCTP